jgi:hypothetical protein
MRRRQIWIKFLDELFECHPAILIPVQKIEQACCHTFHVVVFLLIEGLNKVLNVDGFSTCSHPFKVLPKVKYLLFSDCSALLEIVNKQHTSMIILLNFFLANLDLPLVISLESLIWLRFISKFVVSQEFVSEASSFDNGWETRAEDLTCLRLIVLFVLVKDSWHFLLFWFCWLLVLRVELTLDKFEESFLSFLLTLNASS